MVLVLIVVAGVGFLIRCFFAFTEELMGRNGGAMFSFRRKSGAKRVQGVIEFPRGLARAPQEQESKQRTSAGARRMITVLVITALAASSNAQQGKSSHDPDSEIQQLRSLVRELQTLVEQLEKERQVPAVATDSPSPGTALTPHRADGKSANVSPSLTPDDRGILDFFRATTFNFTLDGYYGYNFNQPVGRVNLLRAYDVSSNSFSINQVNLLVEQAPDPSAGRRFGARLDFQYGQATESTQGSTVNELRPQAYRPLFQAYGTYVAPVGSGLTIDFGKFASALGIEGNYTKDQINYSRSYLFDFLPFYHTGFRTTYSINPKLAFSYWLVNGIQQTEDFNGFKSQAFLFTIKPNSKVSWNVNYYTGQEQPDVVAVLNPGLPTGPTQPGLPITNISPAPNGREHIIDSYATWTPTGKLTLAAEGDYVINRLFSHSSPAHDVGGAGYIRYQFTPKFALDTRAEYLSDRGALFSGVSQALKENTFTAEYKFAEGFLARAEYRRDYSNRPFFLTDVAGKLDKEQNTATLGLVWWMGRKQGSW